MSVPKVVFEPTKRQEVALSTTATEVLFGGARGGGKTEAGLWWLLDNKDNHELKALVIRKNAQDLRDFIERAKVAWTPFGCTFKGDPLIATFPSGYVIKFGHLATENAFTNYQGWEIHKLYIEELTLIPSESSYKMLLASVRSTVKGIDAQIFCTTNPGGPGHEWVKDRFRIGIEEEDKKFTKSYGPNKEFKRTFIYIPAKVMDNPYLYGVDDQYMSILYDQDSSTRERWINGSWDDYDIDGAYYITKMNDLLHDKKLTNIAIEPLLETYTAWDLGINDAMSIWIIQRLGGEYRAINYYENSGEGFAFYVNYLKEFATKNSITYTRHYGPHDLSVRDVMTGKSRLYTAKKMGINFNLVKRGKVMEGIEATRNILGKFYFDVDRCALGIKCLKNYRKEKDISLGVYKDKPLHDWASHGADAFRTFSMGVRNVTELKQPKRVEQSIDWGSYGV